MSYPSYPFYWRHRITVYFVMSILFALALRVMANLYRFTIVVDIMDLPAFQHEDLGFEIEMPQAVIHWFESFLCRRADYLWVCSSSLCSLIAARYGVSDERLLVVLNGFNECGTPAVADNDPTVRFAYAGSLNAERGIAAVIDAFLSADISDSELHLCGPLGDWIPQIYQDPRVKYHGSLTDHEACGVLAGCSVGLVPYPEVGYYNLAFATKLAFYMGIGIPVLCSNAEETSSHVRRMEVGLCWPIDDFASAIKYVAGHPEEIRLWRGQVLDRRDEFHWQSIYSRALNAVCTADEHRVETNSIAKRDSRSRL